MLIGVLSCRPAAAQQDCTPDAQLTEAAAELLLEHNERPSAQALTSAVRAAGSDAVGVHALFVPANANRGSEQEWLTSLRRRVDGDLYCGRADNDAGRLLIGVGRGAALEPIDAEARIVRGRLHAGFRNAELVIETADAQLLRVGVDAASLRRGVELTPDLSLPIKVQLVARGQAGPRPVAEREVRAQRLGEERPAVEREVRAQRVREERSNAAVSGAEELSRSLLAMRAQRGRGGLRSNRLLREAAHQHAADVCAKGRVAHEIEAGIGPDERLARAGLDARVLGEAIARANDTATALDALKNSPSHLYTLLDPRFTDFGIGVAQDSTQKYCYVVLLCAWPRYVGRPR
jgi:uncharacterized protein YkwD